MLKIKISSPEKKFLFDFIETIEAFLAIKIHKKSVRKKKTVVTFLKSPHVNKKSQRQVEYQTHSCVLTINNTFKSHVKTIYFLKKIITKHFFGVTLNTLVFFCPKSNFTQQLKRKSFKFLVISVHYYLATLETIGKLKVTKL